MTKSFADALADFLDENNVRISFNPSDIPTSIIHDATYRATVLAFAIQKLGTKASMHTYKINSTLLALGQYLAMRPKLLDQFEVWIRSCKNPNYLSLSDIPFLPRGHFNDLAHSNMIAMLLVSGELYLESGDYLVWDLTKAKVLAKVVAAANEQNLFSNEINALQRIKVLGPRLNILGIR